jgi:glycosyltransferase involved in cell wall biosynthesis
MIIVEVWALREAYYRCIHEPLNKIVEHGIDGYVVKNRPEIWAEHIHLLMTNKELSRQMGDNGYKKLVIEYSIDKQINKLEKLYMRLVAENCILS